MKTKYFNGVTSGSGPIMHNCLQPIPHKGFIAFLVVFCFLGCIQKAYPVPSFSRQTNMACNACHTVFPRLTTMGRLFKMNAYNITGNSTIESQDKNGKTMLKLLTLSPLSVMFQTSYTHLNTKQPGTQNDNFEFPQALSLFYGGGIAPHLGMFIQMTYEGQSGTIGLDNTDIRYANSTTLFKKGLVYGFTLNNNPTVQDVWNSTPAWGFPFVTSDVVPSPQEATMIEGGLEQAVAGFGAYALFNNLVYGEFSLYRSSPLGVPAPPDSTGSMIIKGVSPYWRLAFQKNFSKHYMEIGTFGLNTHLYPEGVSGLSDGFLDLGFDLQYEYAMNIGNIIVHSSFVNEKRTLEATYDAGESGHETISLNSFKLDGTVYFQKGFAATLGYFAVSGDQDDALYTPGSVSGNRSGVPNSNGFIVQLDFLPWYNTNFSLQYTYYNKFNGAKSDYDGFGRNATDNNSIYLLVWVNF